MRSSAISFMALMWGACSTIAEPKYRPEILGLTEMSLEYIQSEWGEPEYKLPKSSGTSVRFEKVLSTDEDPITEEQTNKVCTVNLDVNKEGLVSDWEYSQCQEVTLEK